MSWKKVLTLGAVATFLIAGTIFVDADRIRHASDPQPGWIAVGGLELALLVLAPRIYHLVHSAKQVVRIEQKPVMWAVLVCCGIALLGILDHFHLPPPIPARLALAGYGLYWLGAGAYLALSMSARARIRAGWIPIALMCAQGAVATAAFQRMGAPFDALWMGVVTALAVIYVTIACIVPGKVDDRLAKTRERVVTRARTSSE